jgi:hypothetical protein
VNTLQRKRWDEIERKRAMNKTRMKRKKINTRSNREWEDKDGL